MSSEEERVVEKTPTQDRNDIPFEKGYQPERGNLRPPRSSSGRLRRSSKITDWHKPS